MFRNYVRNPRTGSPINLGIARILLAVYLIWVILSVQWGLLLEYPLINYHENTQALSPLFPEYIFENLRGIVWITIFVLILFAIGLYIKIVAFTGSFLVCYLGVIRFHVHGTWSTHMFFAASILIMFYALYDEQDMFSIDGLRSVLREDKLDKHLQSSLPPSFRSTPLTLFLVALGFLYFGSGLAKAVIGSHRWISSMNLGRHMYRPVQVGYSPELRDILLQLDEFLVVMAAITIIVELGFLLSIILNRLFSIFVVLLFGFHIGIALLMGPVFLYTMVFLALFVDWGRIIARVQPETSIDVVYDRDSVHVSILYFVKYIDVTKTISFYPQSNASSAVKDRNLVDDDAIVVVRGDATYSGYEAYVQLLRHIRVLAPLSLLLRTPPIATICRHKSS